MIYRERLTTPASWWVIAFFFGVTTATAIGFYVGPGWAVVAGGLTALVLIAGLVIIGSPAIVVDDEGLFVGRFFLDWQYLGEVTTLDEDRTRDRLGPLANAKAFVIQRPYIAESVEIVVVDDADPHPYWQISTRQPAQLAAAIERTRPGEAK